MVHPDFRGMKLSRRLYQARKRACIERNQARIMIAGRIPDYHQVATEMYRTEMISAETSKRLFTLKMVRNMQYERRL